MKKGKRIASVVLVLAMLLSMFTVVNADETPAQETIVYREFMGNNGLFNDTASGLGGEAYNMWKLMTNGGATRFSGGDWAASARLLPLTDEEAKEYADADKYGTHFSIKKDSYGNEELFLNAITTQNESLQPLPMFAWANARIEIDVWSTATDSANYPVGMGLKLSANGTESWQGTTVSHNWESRKWNRYSVPLKNLVTTKYSEAKGLWFRLRMPSKVTEDFDIYFRNFRIVYNPSINVDAVASASGKKVTLTYEPYGGITADSYDIYRNGKLIAENVTDVTYVDDVVPNNEYTYTVKSKSNGAVTASVDTVIMPIREAKTAQTYFDATSQGPLENRDGYAGANPYELGIRGSENDYWSSRISTYNNGWNSISARVSDLTTEEKEKYGADKGFSMDIPANSLPSSSALFVRLHSTRNGVATDDYKKLPAEYWNSAYITFEVWDSVGTNYPTAIKMPVFAKDGENGTWISCGETTVPITNDYAPRKWNHVEIPLSSFANKHTEAKIEANSNDSNGKNRIQLLFGGHNMNNDASTMFIRNLKICYAPGVDVSAAAELNKVTLNLAPYDVEPESYTIYRDGEKIAEGVTGTTYTDTVNGIGSYDYTVEVIADGDAVAEGKASVMVYPFNREKDSEMADFLSKGGNSSFDNIAFTYDVATPSIADFAPQTGGFSWKWNYDITNNGITGITGDLVQQYKFGNNSKIAILPGQNLELMIYTDAESKDKLPKGISVFYNNDENSYGIWDLKNRIELGKWNYISIPASKLGVTEDHLDGRIINRVEIVADSLAGAEKSFNVYVANMGISGENLSVAASVTNDGILITGSTYVDGTTYKLFKNNSDAPLFELNTKTFEKYDGYLDKITEYNVATKYTLYAYDESGNVISSAECSVKVDAPTEGIILAVVGNEPVNECSVNDKVTVRAYPAKGSAESFVVMAATYAADGSLLKAENVTDGSFVPTTAGKVKFMILDGMTNLVPLANAKTLIVK